MEKRAFNDGLGEILRAGLDLPDATGRGSRIRMGAAFALAAAALVVAMNLWIGN